MRNQGLPLDQIEETKFVVTAVRNMSDRESYTAQQARYQNDHHASCREGDEWRGNRNGARNYASRLVICMPPIMSSTAVYPAITASPTHGENTKFGCPPRESTVIPIREGRNRTMSL